MNKHQIEDLDDPREYVYLAREVDKEIAAKGEEIARLNREIGYLQRDLEEAKANIRYLEREIRHPEWR